VIDCQGFSDGRQGHLTGSATTRAGEMFGRDAVFLSAIAADADDRHVGPPLSESLANIIVQILFAQGILYLAHSFDLLDGNRIRRGSNRSRDWQGRRAEEEFENVVLRAVEGEIPDVKNLAHTDADHGNHNPMPGL